MLKQLMIGTAIGGLMIGSAAAQSPSDGKAGRAAGCHFARDAAGWRVLDAERDAAGRRFGDAERLEHRFGLAAGDQFAAA